MPCCATWRCARSASDPADTPPESPPHRRPARYGRHASSRRSPGSQIVRAAARGQRWAGPPPLLILFTVAGFLAPGRSAPPGTPPRPAGRAELGGRGRPSSRARPPRRRTSAHGRGGAEDRATARDRRGPFNQYRSCPSRRRVRTRSRSPAETPSTSSVGRRRTPAPRSSPPPQRGWDTKRFPHGAQALAVSWRRSEFGWCRRCPGWWRAAWTRRSAATRSATGSSSGSRSGPARPAGC